MRNSLARGILWRPDLDFAGRASLERAQIENRGGLAEALIQEGFQFSILDSFNSQIYGKSM
jgi:hypothetical protein